MKFWNQYCDNQLFSISDVISTFTERKKCFCKNMKGSLQAHIYYTVAWSQHTIASTYYWRCNSQYDISVAWSLWKPLHSDVPSQWFRQRQLPYCNRGIASWKPCNKWLYWASQDNCHYHLIYRTRATEIALKRIRTKMWFSLFLNINEIRYLSLKVN